MHEIEEKLNIAVIDEDTNFWMVRTKGGFFYQQFVMEKFIAVGWNSITKRELEGGLTKAKEAELRKNVKENYGDSVPGTAVGKCEKFYSAMKAGDIAVIIGNHQIAVARIGEYYESSNPVHTVQSEKEVHDAIKKASISSAQFEYPYIKRRHIEVLKLIHKETYINPYLSNVLFANRHSISNLTDSAEIILTSCFDAYIYMGKLNLVFRAKQKGNINALAFSGFVYGVSDFLTNGRPEDVTVKVALRSPGDILMQISNGIQYLIDNWGLLLLAYFAIFGGKIKHGDNELEMNSVIGVVREFIDRDHTKRMQTIDYEQKCAEKKMAEAEAEGKLLDNEMKQLEIDDRKREAQLKRISQSAESLEIEGRSAVIIQLDDLLRRKDSKP